MCAKKIATNVSRHRLVSHPPATAKVDLSPMTCGLQNDVAADITFQLVRTHASCSNTLELARRPGAQNMTASE